mgnify:CR=1 FL=1
MALVVDIETVAISPTEEELVEIKAGIKPPANYKKQETIDKWMDEQAPLVLADKIAKRSLDPFTNQIVAISAKYHGVSSASMPILFNECTDREDNLLEEFVWVIALKGSHYDPYPFVGVNIFGFDLPIIALHLAKHNIDPCGINFTPSKYDKSKVIDLMTFFDGKFRSVEALARFLSIDTSHNPISGAEVQEYWDRGDLETIGKHCAVDVEIEWNIYDRLHKIIGS